MSVDMFVHFFHFSLFIRFAKGVRIAGRTCIESVADHTAIPFGLENAQAVHKYMNIKSAKQNGKYVHLTYIH